MLIIYITYISNVFYGNTFDTNLEVLRGSENLFNATQCMHSSGQDETQYYWHM